MTGMKEGAGEDPFAEDTGTAGPEPSAAAESGTSSSTAAEPVESGDSSADREPTEPAQSDRGGRSIEIPYKFRRDSVQDGRDRVPLFLQEDTKRAERDAVRELEERFDDDVSLTDLREALVKVGLANLDGVEDHLEAWGYGMTFD